MELDGWRGQERVEKRELRVVVGSTMGGSDRTQGRGWVDDGWFRANSGSWPMSTMAREQGRRPAR
jgi:hypothetical protein